MQLFITIVAFILIFSVLVLVHELGHFWFAKRVKIRVEEFGMGLPPRIWGVKKGETLYSLNAIPFGGFVRLYGEDPRDKKARSSKRSFISQSLARRFMVVFAGVMMNFILALVLLSIGFIVGIKPLIVNSDDLFTHVRSGVVELTSWMAIREVKQGSWAEKVGIMPGDVLYSANGKLASKEFLSIEKCSGLDECSFFDTTSLRVRFFRDSSTFERVWSVEDSAFGVLFHQIVSIPRLYLYDVVAYSEAASLGLAKGDILVRVNGYDVFYPEDLDHALNRAQDLRFEIIRDGQTVILQGKRMVSNVIVSELVPGTIASTSGFERGDILVSIDDQAVFTLNDIPKLRSSIAGRTVRYVVNRHGQLLLFDVNVPQSGQIGLFLSSLYSPSRMGFDVFQSTLTTSISEINTIKLPFYRAPQVALSELFRLTGISFVALKNLFRDIAISQTVSPDVGGPVKIAQLTYSFVNEGFWSLVRFTALLSMSLAVVNLLPIPALDGGRLFFIIVEFIRGRPIDFRFEAFLHRLGFILLIGLILFVTYNDILAIFSG